MKKKKKEKSGGFGTSTQPQRLPLGKALTLLKQLMKGEEDVRHVATTASYLADNNAAAIFITERSMLLK